MPRSPRRTLLLLPLLAACGPRGGNADPTLAILAPLDGARVAEGAGLRLRVEVDDPGGVLPVSLTVRSDLDGLVHTSDALATPQTYEAAVRLGTLARHVLTFVASDPDGGRGEATVEVVVNRAPTDPVVAIEPADPVAGEALVGRVSAPARDASPLGYAWTWFRGDTPVAAGEGDRRARVDAGETSAGEVWRVRFEAYEKLGDERDPEGTSSFGEASVAIGVPDDSDADTGP